MNRSLARHATTLSMWHCLRTATLPTLATALVALAGAHWSAPMVASKSAATGALSPWLALPIFVAATMCAVATATFWPLFSARRPGADWLIRLQRGPLQGCGAVISGALLAQLLLCSVLSTALAAALGSPAAARSHFVLQSPAEPLLTATTHRLQFHLGESAWCDELRLRPLASLPTGPMRASRVQAMVDGTPLATTASSFDQTGQLVRITFPARAIESVELVFEDGTVPLFFPTGSVELIGANDRSGIANGLFTALLAQLPLFLALALACLVGTTAALPTVLVALLGVLFVSTIGGLGPLAEALRLQLRGHWLPSTHVFRQCLPSLMLGSTAMIGAMLLRRRTRR